MSRGTQTQAKGVLYVVATPIGNLEDITFRALRILSEAAVIAAEDTRVFAKLASRHGIATRVTTIRGKSASRNMEKIIETLTQGDDVALVTDAGTPSVSDPGFELVTAARGRGIAVSPVPGPSALAAAVSVAGLQGDGVRFYGFLPRSGRRRTDLLSAIAYEGGLCVIYESPRRLAGTLKDLAGICGSRRAAVLRELTKLHEEVLTGTVATLEEEIAAHPARGEITLVIEGARADADTCPEAELRRLIDDEVAAGASTRDIVSKLSRGLGVSRKMVYSLALEALSRKNCDE